MNKKLLIPLWIRKIMKLSFYQFVLCAILCGASYAHETSGQAVLDMRVSLDVQGVRFKKVLSMLGEQADVRFVYSSNSIDIQRKVKLKAVNQRLDLVLKELLSPYAIAFTVSDDKMISLKPVLPSKQGSITIPELTAEKLAREVGGRVVDENGEALPGVSILVKGTQQGLITDTDGRFTIEVADENAVLVFSFVGFLPQEVVVGSRTSFEVSLKVDQKNLEEVVVVGYGTQRKKDVTGSVVSIKADQFMQPSTNSFDQMLQGKVPGVQVTQTTGAPGGNVNILVRGVSSITGGNQPLYVIDGFPIGSGGGGSNMRSYGNSSFSSSGMANNTATRINPLSSINPSDIESIEILKDASATAIYGSRGSNGVVIITTKRGAYGKSQISLDASYGFQEVARKLNLMNSRQYAEFVAEARDNTWEFAGGKRTDPNEVRSAATRVPSAFRNPEGIVTDTDWQDVIFRTAPVRNLQVSAAGGTEKARFMISGGYFTQEGIIINSNYNRFNLRINLDAQITKRIKIGTSTYGSYGFGNFANTESHYGAGGILSNAISAAPTIPVYDSNGNYYFNQEDVTYGLGFLQNVLAVSNGTEDKRKAIDIFTNNFVEVGITDELTFKSTVGISYNTNMIRLWRSSAVPLNTNLNYPASAGSTMTGTLNWLNENTLTYSKVLDQKHFINGIVGFTAQKSSSDRLSAGASDFPTEYVPYISAGIVNAGTQTINEWSLLSWMARANYSYAGKYMFTATIRSDGSSRFGANNKWGAFPSFSVGYNLAEENFMKDLNWISNLKLRASYGISGNNQIGNYTHIGLLSPTRYVENNSLKPGLIPSSLSNDDLTWEKSIQTNLGLDLGLFRERVNLSLDLYRNLKTDLLLAVQLPAASGFTSSTQNIGDIENKGVELGLNTVNISKKSFEWTSGFTFSANRNKVLKLATEGGRIANSDYQITQVGAPLASFFLIRKLGVFMNSNELEGAALYHPKTQAGDLKFEDINGDKVINQNDRQVMGSPWPDFTWGFDNSFRLGGVSLGISLVGSKGAYTYLETGFAATFLGSAGVQNGSVLQDRRWRSESNPGDGMVSRAIRSNHAYSFGTSSHYLFDNSFTRIKNVNLSYDLPSALISRLKLNSFTVYFNISNLHTFTDYVGYDPESSTTGDNASNAGIDYLNYPLPRTFTLGIRTSF